MDQEPSTSNESKGWYSRGYLPHFDAPGLIQHITFHLADSLPGNVLRRMQDELDILPESKRSIERRKRIQALLDQGLGSCLLRRSVCAEIVESTFHFGDGDRYRLLAWVVMPNHVHVLIEQLPGWKLPRIVQSWKRHSSREIHRLYADVHDQSEVNALWQRDYWDRFIRDEHHFWTAKQYIDENPVSAGLVDSPAHWPWGSARFEQDAGRSSPFSGED